MLSGCRASGTLNEKLPTKSINYLFLKVFLATQMESQHKGIKAFKRATLQGRTAASNSARSLTQPNSQPRSHPHSSQPDTYID
jgi:hypothetical protein